MARSPYWRCEVCGAQNHEIDDTCQFCDGDPEGDHPATQDAIARYRAARRELEDV